MCIRDRLRTTHESMRERSTWKGNGRATIDPNHSPRVEGDHYLSATTPAQRDAVDTIIACVLDDRVHGVTLSRRRTGYVVVAFPRGTVVGGDRGSAVALPCAPLPHR